MLAKIRTAGRNVSPDTMEPLRRLLKRLKTDHLEDHVKSLLGIYPKNSRIAYDRDTYTALGIGAPP